MNFFLVKLLYLQQKIWTHSHRAADFGLRVDAQRVFTLGTNVKINIFATLLVTSTNVNKT